MKSIQIEVPKGYEIDKDKSTFEKIIFKEIENKLPSSWEELNKVSGCYIFSNSDVRVINDIDTVKESRNIFPTKEQTNASVALAQLLQLRDKYRNSETCPYDINNKYYSIYLYLNKWKTFEPTFMNNTFAFQTKELRDLFFENFKDLLEEVKPLFI